MLGIGKYPYTRTVYYVHVRECMNVQECMNSCNVQTGISKFEKKFQV